MIIDFHTHAFPEKIVKKAIDILTHNAATIPFTDGTVEGLVERADSNGIDYSVVLNIATNVTQQKSVNDFAIELDKHEKIISFGSVHPFSENALSELERLKAAGIKGVKMHPDYQGFFVDDPKTFPVYEKISELGLIMVFHAGLDLGVYSPMHCPPERLKKALPVFNGSPVVAAHFGGFEAWYSVEEHLVGEDLYFDTSYCYGRMPYRHAEKIMKAHGSDRILFGSDMPWSGVHHELNFVRAFAEGEDLEKILCLNARKLLNI